MAIIGISLDRTNPKFTIDDFTFWMPQYTKFLATEKGQKYFEKLYSVANKKVFHSIFGTDWELAMSYVIAHYLTLIANRLGAPSGDSLESIAGGGNIQGVLSSASVGNFSKQYDIDKTITAETDALFWNQTSYGAAYWALLKTKAIPTIMVVTSNPIGETRFNKQEEKSVVPEILSQIEQAKEDINIQNQRITNVDNKIPEITEADGIISIKTKGGN